MEQNKLVFGIALICIVLTSAVVLAQEVVEPRVGEVRIQTKDGDQCIAIINSENCPTVSCLDDKYTESNCPPEYINNPEPFVEAVEGKPCISYGYYDDFDNKMDKQICLGTVVTFDKTYEKEFCTAYIDSNGCAESFCTIGKRHEGLCPTEGVQCHIENDLMHNCLNLVCGNNRKDVCIDDIYAEYVVQPQKEETKTVLLRNPRTAISNVLYASQIFYGLKIKADTLADYYDVVGDTTNAQKYRSVASQFLEVSNMFDALRTKLIQKTVGLADMNELSESDKTEIINDAIQIENKVNQIKEILYG